jgi:hypothetical protein
MGATIKEASIEDVSIKEPTIEDAACNEDIFMVVNYDLESS